MSTGNPPNLMQTKITSNEKSTIKKSMFAPQ